jgi:hypothetical protein
MSKPILFLWMFEVLHGAEIIILFLPRDNILVSSHCLVISSLYILLVHRLNVELGRYQAKYRSLSSQVRSYIKYSMLQQLKYREMLE